MSERFWSIGNPLPSEKSLIKEIEKGLSGITLRPTGNKIYASNSGICSRRTVYSGEPSLFFPERDFTSDPASGLYTTVGEAVHEKLNEALFNSKRLLFSELKLPATKGLYLSGRLDAIILDVDDKIKVLEIKTCGELPNEPKHAHRIQALIYGAASGLPVKIVYVSRDIADYKGIKIREFDIDFTYEEVHKIFTNLYISTRSMELNVLPSRGLPNKTACKKIYCPFVPSCWSDVHDELEASPEVENAIIKSAEKSASEFLSRSDNRRNGILLHIKKHGNHHAQKVLSTDWTPILTERLYSD